MGGENMKIVCFFFLRYHLQQKHAKTWSSLYFVNYALVERKRESYRLRELHRRRRAWLDFVFVCLTFLFVVLCRERFALNELVRDLGGPAPCP